MPTSVSKQSASQVDEFGSLDPLARPDSDESDSRSHSVSADESNDEKWHLRRRPSTSASRRRKQHAPKQSLRQQLSQSLASSKTDRDRKKTKDEDWRKAGYTRDDPLPVRPGFIVELLLLVLLGLRTRRLQVRLLNEDPQKVWTSFRDSLVKRWTQMSVTSSLLVAATGMSTTSTVADEPRLAIALNLALCARAAALIAVIFGTGLALVFVDCNPKDLAKLAARPVHMVFVLSAPTGFAIAGMALFYASMLATTLVEGHIVAKCVVIGAGVWLFFLGCYCAYLVWLIADKDD